MQVAILAGGIGTRLGGLTQDRPKSMVQILRKPFLEYQIELLKKQGVEDIILCIGHLGEQVGSYFGDGGKFGVNIKYSHEDKLLGTAGALRNARDLLDDIFFTMYGDSYLFLDFGAAISYFKSQNKLALMSVYKNYDCYDRSNAVVEGELIKKFSKEEKTEDMVYIEYGANIFRKDVLQMISEDKPYSLSKLFTRLIGKKELLAYEVMERFYEIGSPSGLKDFEEYAKNILYPKSNKITANPKLNKQGAI